VLYLLDPADPARAAHPLDDESKLHGVITVLRSVATGRAWSHCSTHAPPTAVESRLTVAARRVQSSDGPARIDIGRGVGD